ncbi:hypothetical protein GDO86_017293 [Hymenochirus boettgeri]|uniref:Uncharacterized protein n=1 Tax=Hymenochirus boettgeri TaxID=247094 RepID=A0A8T2IPZ9_9PIPI|nr:hypothetical protein GDO86_017293 [Hymenochirus boettgeri]
MKIVEMFTILLILKEVRPQTKRAHKANMKRPLPKRKGYILNTEGDRSTEMSPANFRLVEQSMSQMRDPTLLPQQQQKSQDDMKLHFLKNTLVTCNDRTAAGYYLREAKGNKRWIIFLEGGWCCYSKGTCDIRYNNVRRLMSSSHWPQTRKGTGIMSSKQNENPYWWNQNAVFVPYCSSDVWSGNVSRYQDGYAFMGSMIIQEVIQDLVPKGFKQAKSVILAGSSAGGTGVLLNIDRVAELVEELTTESVQVRGLVDSGWFLDPKHTDQSDCLDISKCALTEAIKKGLKLWNGILPENCKQQFKKGDEWKCFYGRRLFTSMKSPIFVVQWLYDEEQLRIENLQADFQSMTENQWNSIQIIGREFKKSLREVPAVFAPACLSHTLITKSNWLDFQVKGVNLAKALHCWDRSQQENRGPKTVIRGCPFHLIDNCHWPHCNPTCPAIYDAMSGQEVSILQMFLKLRLENQRRGQEPKGDLGPLISLLRNSG